MTLYDPNYVHVKQFHVIGVKCFLEDNTGDILVVRRSPLIAKETWPHSWSLPGGAVEHGDTFEETCRREVIEETAISITKITLQKSFAARSGNDFAVILFCTAPVERVNPTLDWEHDAYRWTSPQEAIQLLSGIGQEACKAIYSL